MRFKTQWVHSPIKKNIRIKIDKEYKLVSKKEEKKPWDNNWAKYSVHSPQSY